VLEARPSDGPQSCRPGGTKSGRGRWRAFFFFIVHVGRDIVGRRARRAHDLRWRRRMTGAECRGNAAGGPARRRWSSVPQPKARLFTLKRAEDGRALGADRHHGPSGEAPTHRRTNRISSDKGIRHDRMPRCFGARASRGPLADPYGLDNSTRLLRFLVHAGSLATTACAGRQVLGASWGMVGCPPDDGDGVAPGQAEDTTVPLQCRQAATGLTLSAHAHSGWPRTSPSRENGRRIVHAGVDQRPQAWKCPVEGATWRIRPLMFRTAGTAARPGNLRTAHPVLGTFSLVTGNGWIWPKLRTLRQGRRYSHLTAGARLNTAVAEPPPRGACDSGI